MSEKINLNVSPYFDDFNEDSNYTKVLFKPGTSIQARELTTLQSSLQNQIEKFSNTAFYDGQIVDSGEINYISSFDFVLLEDNFNGIPIVNYIEQFENLIIRGQSSGIRAKVVKVLTSTNSEKSRNTLYVKYLNSASNFETNTFLDSENIVTETSVTTGTTTFFENNAFCKCIENNSIGKASAVSINEGTCYVRGFFVKFSSNLVLLDQYSTKPNYKIGFSITEKIIKSLDDPSLNDNARGFSNFSAPGADRLQISCAFVKKSLDETDTDNFFELLRIEDGKITSQAKNTSYQFIQDELARRTYDESGDYVVDDFNINIRESLNNLIDKDGLYFSNEKTYNNNKPSDNLITLSISPGKAFVRGYEIEKIANTLIDVEKARDSQDVTNTTIPINFGKSFNINNINGNLDIGVNSYYVELRNRRKDASHLSGSGNIVGYCRAYDAKLLESYEDDSSKSELYIYDLQLITELTVSSDIVTYSVGSQIKGASSGAIGYVRGSDGLLNNPGGTNTFTIFQVSGKFVPGEKYYVNGNLDSRIINHVSNYTSSDAKSLRIVGSGYTFTADLDLSQVIDIKVNNTFNISARDSGISTITSTSDLFLTNLKINDIVRYTNPGFSTSTYNRVTGIITATNQIEIASVLSSNGVCVGSLPQSDISVNDLVVVRPELKKSVDYGLYASLPNNLISDIDIDNSILTVRKNYSVTVSNNSATVNEGSSNLSFLPFTNNRYILQYSNGNIEPLTSSKISVSGDSKTLTFKSLDQASDADAKLIATLVKTSLKTTTKLIKRCDTLVLNDSVLVYSGTGNQTNNDGLSYNSTGLYGTRVQDDELCLNHPDVIKVHAIFESSTTANPLVPTITLSNSGNLTESIIGEEFYGENSKAVGRVVGSLVGQSNTSTKVNFVFLTDRVFKIGENVVFKSSGLKGTVNSISFGDKNIINEYILDNGQREDFYDYSRLIKKNTSDYVPQKRILVVFDRYYIEGSSQDFVNVDSYSFVDFERDIPIFNNKRNSDILDFRPRVGFYNKNTASYGPFHFLNRSFAKNSSSMTIVDDESITLDYSFYLPRIDKLVLTKEGVFEYKTGKSSINPQQPLIDENSLDIATFFYPSYTFNASDVKIKVSNHKRYTMSDLRNLENRVENLELYTTLSLLESETNNIKIEDPLTGIERFKSGFFVDSFVNNTTQDIFNESFSCSIDKKLGELRPPHYTTSIDLILGSKSLLGIGTEADPDIDLSQAKDLESENLQRTGNIITLKYNESVLKDQSYANSSIKVNNSNISNFSGNLKLYPSSETWFDENNYELTVENVFDQFKLDKLSNKPNTNFYEVEWDSWKNFWSGIVKTKESQNINGKIKDYFWDYDYNQNINGETYKNSISSISLNSEVNTKNSKTQSNRYFNKIVSPYMRSRNIGFDVNSLRPKTRFYSFMDNISVDDLIIPKLIEIEMLSGSFSVGEDVFGFIETEDRKDNIASINFRLSATNHMGGDYLNPSETYDQNPYSGSTLQSTYSQTSTVLNVDIQSLSSKVISKYYGYVEVGMTLIGKTSGAQARISNIRLISNENGVLQGSVYIPEPKGLNKKFLTGKNAFRLNSNKFNDPTAESSFAESIFNSFGFIPLNQNGVISIRPSEINKQKLNSNTISNSFVTNIFENNEFENNLLKNYNYANPIVQFFSVIEPSGVFLSSVDLYIKAKDNNLPLNVEIRTTSGGIPTSVVVPLSKVSLSSSSINVSTDSSVATNFKFESPVYIEPNKVYGLVVYSDSDEYEIFISNFNDAQTPDLLTNTSLNKSSSIGNLFIPNNTDINVEKNSNLKVKLYNAKFVNASGSLTLYNSNLDIGNDHRPRLENNPLILKSRKITVDLNSDITTSGIATIGYQITQSNNETATGILVQTGGKVGLGTTSLNVSFVGTGLTPSSGTFSYSGVNFTTLSGNGSGLVGIVSVTNGQIDWVDVTNGGTGYLPNDVVTATIGNTGVDYRFSVGIRTSIDTFILNDVQGKFNLSGDLLLRNISTGSTSTIIQNIIPSNISEYEDDLDGLHFIVNHKNNFMYSDLNKVEISNVEGDIPSSILSSEITESDTTINLNSVSNLSQFEGVGIGTTNAGYVKINDEIIKYESITGSSLTDVTRGVDSTIAAYHKSGSIVKKYEINGVSLRRINTSFNISDKTTTKTPNNDQYYLKIDTSLNGTNRSGSGELPRLSFNKTRSLGGDKVRATQNVQFDSVTPNIQTFIPTSCNIESSIRTITGTSDNGSEISFVDKGFEKISLLDSNNFDTPRLITSRINENERLANLPGKKSLSMRLDLTTNDQNVSPVIDLDRCNLILTSNIINDPISDYASDSRVNTLLGDPHRCIYITKQIDLNISANSLKVIFDAYKPYNSDIRVLYKLITEDKDKYSDKFVLFPGYSNTDLLGNVINDKDSDGTSDKFVNYSNPGEFKEHVFTINNREPFLGFVIKIVMSSTNSANVPRIKNLKGIALS